MANATGAIPDIMAMTIGNKSVGTDLPAVSRCVSECLIHETVLLPTPETRQLSIAILPSIAVTLPDWASINSGAWPPPDLSLITTSHSTTFIFYVWDNILKLQIHLFEV